MKEVGIRELKGRASELVRRVQEDRATYTITKHGHPVGVLAPADWAGTARPSDADNAWARIQDLWAQADAGAKTRRSAIRELARMRR